MIALVRLDSRRHCLHQLDSGTGPYVCRRRIDHRGQHDYLPMDMVIVTEASAAVAPPGGPAAMD
jgi:hypothetical protein